MKISTERLLVVLCLQGLLIVPSATFAGKPQLPMSSAPPNSFLRSPVAAQVGAPRSYQDSQTVDSPEMLVPGPTLPPPESPQNLHEDYGQKVNRPEAKHYSLEFVKEPVERKKPSYPTVKLTGFFHLDGAYFRQDADSLATVGDIQDGLAFRRARLAATGNLTEDITYIMEFDFADFQARFVDVWVNFAKVPYVGNVRIGRWRQPFGMDALTSIRDISFMERNLGFAFSPFRQTGIGAFDRSADERTTWAASLYRYESDFFGNSVGDNGGIGLASRVTWLPFYRGDGSLFHVGCDYSYNDPGRDFVFYLAPPEVFVGQSIAGILPAPILGTPPFVNTGIVPVQHTNLFNLEAAFARGPFVVQTEARWAVIDQLSGPSRTLPAAYALVRYVLTGETIPYDTKHGVFGRVKPRRPVQWRRGGCGAWELVGRWSYIDLNGTIGDGPGRSLNNLTFGVNWYVNDYVRFEFNYIHAFLSDPILGSSNADIFAFRTQMDF